jgi:hypothetical protein
VRIVVGTYCADAGNPSSVTGEIADATARPKRDHASLQGPQSTGVRVSPEAHRDADRAHLLDRLQSLRTIVPVFAQELASARRQAAQLRMENGRLREQVRQLQQKRTSINRRRGLGLSEDVLADMTSIGVVSSLDVADTVAHSSEWV